jgi:hypothetical protein
MVVILLDGFVLRADGSELDTPADGIAPAAADGDRSC